MEGHLYQRGKSKVWYLLYDEPANSSKRNLRSVRIGKMPKAEADAKKREILSAVDKGMVREHAASTTLDAFLNLWMEATRDRLASRTAERYASIVKLHIVPVIGNVKLSRLTPEHVRKVYKAVKDKRAIQSDLPTRAPVASYGAAVRRPRGADPRRTSPGASRRRRWNGVSAHP